MQGIETWTLVYFAIVVTGAFAVRGVAGFGGNIVAVPLLTLAMPLQTTASVMTMFTILSAIPQLARDWRQIAWAEVFRVLPFTLAGVLAGFWVFNIFDPRALSRAFGAFVVIYAACALLMTKQEIAMPPSARWPLAIGLSLVAGMVGFVFGGASSPFYAVYLNTLRLLKDCFRATIATIIAAQAVLRVSGYGSLGFYDDAALALLLAGVPLVLLGTYAGMWIGSTFNQQTFKKVLGSILICSGFALMAK